MKPDTAEQIEEVAKSAAGIYGQSWDEIPEHSKAIWRKAVQEIPAAGGTTKMEKAAGAAVAAYGARKVKEERVIEDPKPSVLKTIRGKKGE